MSLSRRNKNSYFKNILFVAVKVKVELGPHEKEKKIWYFDTLFQIKGSWSKARQ